MDKQETYRADFIKELESQAWRQRANAAFDETKIPEVKKLQDNALAALNGEGGKKEQLTKKQEELAKVTGEVNAFPNRKERTEEQKAEVVKLREKQTEINADIAKLEKEIAKDEEFILGCDETISMINKSIQEHRQKANQLLARVKFARTFNDTLEDEPKVEEKKEEAGN